MGSSQNQAIMKNYYKCIQMAHTQVFVKNKSPLKNKIKMKTKNS